ncbi:DUF126 domain-containing protein [Pararhizobium sp. A13]|uniref:aconitase X swivel domain-containing protein n=1 Tax=Pararhizobium sp. A13 TaxID=3133975 RepID=UPI00324A016C
MTRAVEAITLVPGKAEGQTFVLTEPLSFWGGLDSLTGRIIDQWHPQKNACISGRVLVMKAGRGSSSGSSVLAEAIRRGTGPAGIVLMTRDAIVTVGSMVAVELYGATCPVVLVLEADWDLISRSWGLALEAENPTATLRLLDAVL